MQSVIFGQACVIVGYSYKDLSNFQQVLNIIYFESTISGHAVGGTHSENLQTVPCLIMDGITVSCLIMVA